MVEFKSKKAKGKNAEVVSFALNRIRFNFLLFTFYFLLFTFFAFLLPSVSTAQDDEVAPPPLKVFSKEERSRLDAKSDLKDRTKLALELMDLRLDAAEKFAAGQEFEPMFRELGSFHALMDESLEFLGRRNTGSSGKVLDNFKRLEIGLRMFSPRIETIRRELPVRYDDYVRKLMKHVRDARARAIDPLFGETVIKTKSE